MLSVLQNCARDKYRKVVFDRGVISSLSDSSIWTSLVFLLVIAQTSSTLPFNLSERQEASATANCAIEEAKNLPRTITCRWSMSRTRGAHAGDLNRSFCFVYLDVFSLKIASCKNHMDVSQLLLNGESV